MMATSAKQRLGSVATAIARAEPMLVFLTAPLLLFPTQRPPWTAAALILLVIVWLLRRIAADCPSVRTPMDLSLLLFALNIPIAVWVSPAPDLTIPKLTGVILGLAAFRATINTVRTPADLKIASALFLFLGLGLVLVGVAGADWPSKIPSFQPLVARLPRILQGIPGTRSGVHPNELGGTVLFFFPMSLAWALSSDDGRGWANLVARGTSLLLAFFLIAILILSQSRSAWFGAIAGISTIAWLRWHRARWILLALALLVVAWLLILVPNFATEAMPSGSILHTMLDIDTLRGRSGPWLRAMDIIAHFPITGAGLGAFRQIAHLFGPVPLPEPSSNLAHAHNAFLQVAVDVGIPGLIAYLALLSTALWCAWQVLRYDETPLAWLAMGIVGSLVAFHVYGITDTIALGAKPGLGFWMLLALAAAACNVSRRTGAPVEIPVTAPEPESS